MQNPDQRMSDYLTAHKSANRAGRQIAIAVAKGHVVADALLAQFRDAEQAETNAWRALGGHSTTDVSAPAGPAPFDCACGVTFVCPANPTPGERVEFDSKVAQHRALPHHQAMQRVVLAPADDQLPGVVVPTTTEAVSA